MSRGDREQGLGRVTASGRSGKRILSPRRTVNVQGFAGDKSEKRHELENRLPEYKM
jgi:hypothetical protein